jgi:hypothetical protein
VGAVAGLEEAEAGGVDGLVGDVLLAIEALGDREALGGEARELLEDGGVGAGGAEDALAGSLESEDGEEEALLVVDGGVARGRARLTASRSRCRDWGAFGAEDPLREQMLVYVSTRSLRAVPGAGAGQPLDDECEPTT